MAETAGGPRDLPEPEPSYRAVLGRTGGLQRGFTSGTCALAASVAAALLVTGRRPGEDGVEVRLRKGECLTIPLAEQSLDTAGADPVALCGVVKDSGDDEDITHGHLFRAAVTLTDSPGVVIQGGPGIGKVTRPGLPVPPGEWAINPGPRRMITDNLTPLLPPGKGFLVELSVPDGEELARKTWNPRIGIEGGISIIGTSGIIEPRSSAAYKASIALHVKTLKAGGESELHLAPGYVADAFYRRRFGLEEHRIIRFGDHAGFALNQGPSGGFGRVHLAAHIGKMAKIAAGLFDTHCRTGDARLETVAALAGAAGASREIIRRLLDMKMAEEAVPLLKSEGLEECFDLLAGRTRMRVRKLWEKEYEVLPEIEIYVLDLAGNQLNRRTGGSLEE